MNNEEIREASAKELAAKFLEKNPEAAMVKSSFYGSGDSFGDFDDIDVYNRNEQLIENYNLEDVLQELLWKVIEKDGRAVFDNDGSCGEIEIDFVKGKVKIEISYYETIKNNDGENEYDDLIEPRLFKNPIQDLSNFVKLKNKKKAK